MSNRLPSNVPLFREKALQARAGGVHGAPLLPTFSSARYAAIASVSLLIFIGLVGAFGSYTRKVNVSGQLRYEPAEARIASAKTGIVTAVHVHNGEQVEAGSSLVTISLARSSANIIDVEQRIIVELKNERETLIHHIDDEGALFVERRIGAGDNIKTIQTSAAKLNALIVTAGQRKSLAQGDADRSRRLASEGFIAKSAVEKSDDALLVATQQLQELESRLAAEQGKLASANSDSRELPYENSQRISDLKGQVNEIDRRIAEAEASTTIVLRAATSGLVTNLTAKVGQDVGANEVVAVVVPPDARLYAEAYVPSRAAGFIGQGMQVKLRYHAYPFEKFGQGKGVITHFDETATIPAGGRESSANSPQPYYLATIELNDQDIVAYGKAIKLREGLTFDAEIRQDRRHLYEWLLDPISASGMKL